MSMKMKTAYRKQLVCFTTLVLLELRAEYCYRSEPVDADFACENLFVSIFGDKLPLVMEIQTSFRCSKPSVCCSTYIATRYGAQAD